MPDRYFECVTVACKNKICGTLLVLQVLNEVEHPHPQGQPFRVPIVIDCRDFQESCPACGQESTYSHGDIHVMPLANQTPGVLSRSYSQARSPMGNEGDN